MIESSHQTEKTNGTRSKMSLFLETIHEHALAIDFAMFVVIWIVHIIVYPSFLFLEQKKFLDWHMYYCRKISYFVLPLMTLQLIETVTACFFVGRVWEWIRLVGVITAWAITFFHSAPKHKKLSNQGKNVRVIESLILGNLFRSTVWTVVFSVSFWSY
tara:strand:+ start:729 stop:1202 length:474 start_codon:yes stop_codon:yes gene_type:complete